MISYGGLIELIRPGATDILGIDAQAVQQTGGRKEAFAGLDRQPAATAMAAERRAIVATELRSVIAPKLGWTLIEDYVKCGAYEWIAGSVTIRLSKTTRAMRLEELGHTMPPNIQGTLFKMAAHQAGPRDEVLIRLMGGVFTTPYVDVVSRQPNGELGHPISLKYIAESQTTPLPSSGSPLKARLSIPGVQRPAETG